MKIGFISDTHIGKSLKTNTTLESRQRLKSSLVAAAEAGINELDKADVDIIIHTADLFDKAVNDEADILAGAKIANKCDIVMFGNHDDRNRKDTISSIGLLAATSSIYGDRENDVPTFVPSLWEPGYFFQGYASRNGTYGADIYAVPHCVSQQVFEDSLLKVVSESGSKPNRKRILCLHCNYDNALAAEKEQNLNLTEEMADKLLEVFDFVVAGHEHQLAKRKDGRVISVGSVRPTSFSDISDKFVTIIDTDDDTVTHKLTWSTDLSAKVDVQDLIQPGFADDLMGVEYIDVVGQAKPEQSVAVTDVANQLWKESENLIALRTSKIEYEVSDSENPAEEVSLDSLPETMLSELTGDTHDLLAEALDSLK